MARREDNVTTLAQVTDMTAWGRARGADADAAAGRAALSSPPTSSTACLTNFSGDTRYIAARLGEGPTLVNGWAFAFGFVKHALPGGADQIMACFTNGAVNLGWQICFEHVTKCIRFPLYGGGPLLDSRVLVAGDLDLPHVVAFGALVDGSASAVCLDAEAPTALATTAGYAPPDATCQMWVGRWFGSSNSLDPEDKLFAVVSVQHTCATAGTLATLLSSLCAGFATQTIVTPAPATENWALRAPRMSPLGISHITEGTAPRGISVIGGVQIVPT